MAKVKRKKGKGGFVFFKEFGGAPERIALSKTASVLLEAGLIRGRVLDYGCGHGYDAEQQGWDAWDPYYRPQEPQGPYDTIVVNHVLNILTRASRKALYARVDALLAEGGHAYLSTARNIPVDGKHGPRHRLQNYVLLDLPSVYCDDTEEIYALARGTSFKDRTQEFEDQF